MKGPVAVTGAAGYVGSWLVMKLLQEGYVVRATVRDPTNLTKTEHLLDLPQAKEQLTFWKAELESEGSFDEAFQGCTGVFHVATPVIFESTDPENEVIKPTVNGILTVMRSSKRAQTVKRIIFTSSAGAVKVQEQKPPQFDETWWSNVEFCKRTKMTGWIYFVSKTLAEKAAWGFAKENNLDFISIIPTLVVGPFIMPTMPPSMLTALALILGNEAHYSILKQHNLVHLDDLCNAHIFLLEHPNAEGRYICSSRALTIFELAKMMRERYPEFNIPTTFKGIDESIKPVPLSSKKLMDLGFKFKYTMEEMFDGAIRSCREKNLIPLQNVGKPWDDAENQETIEAHIG